MSDVKLTADQRFIVVRERDGKFLGYLGAWHDEAPDAFLHLNEQDARAAAKRYYSLHSMVYTWEGYGEGKKPVSHVNRPKVARA